MAEAAAKVSRGKKCRLSNSYQARRDPERDYSGHRPSKDGISLTHIFEIVDELPH